VELFFIPQGKRGKRGKLLVLEPIKTQKPHPHFEKRGFCDHEPFSPSNRFKMESFVRYDHPVLL